MLKFRILISTRFYWDIFFITITIIIIITIMCGISGVMCKKNAVQNVMFSLKRLQNRGYDSAGICTFVNDTIIFCKNISDDNGNAIDKISESILTKMESDIAIGHTRWATHGAKTINNAHPHLDMFNEYAIVHNGIIENYKELSEELVNNGYIFKGQTDSEIVVNYIHYVLSNGGKIDDVEKKLIGSWAIIMIDINNKNKITYMKNGSPLIIGFDIQKEKIMFVSELSGFDEDICYYSIIKDGDIGQIDVTDGKINIDSLFNYSFRNLEMIRTDYCPDPYSHWTLKEINDQPQSIIDLLTCRIKSEHENQFELYFPELESMRNKLFDIEHIIFLGCGTSYHAAQIGSRFFKEFRSKITTEVIDGAEFEIIDIPINRRTMMILLSQSGETRDLYRALQIGKENSIRSVGIINVEDSLIAREVDTVLYLKAGYEKAVASTKSFSNQVVMLLMLAMWMNPNMPSELESHYMKSLINLPDEYKKIINQSSNEINDIVRFFHDQHDCFILGKNISEWIAKEGSLKIKEISYYHCEGFSASALKHGPFALLTQNVPVIIIGNDDIYYSKIDNIKSEIKSRSATVIMITNRNIIDNDIDYLFYYNTDSLLFPLLSIIPLQILSYHLACFKNNNPDFPRNLAKVVTVD